MRHFRAVECGIDFFQFAQFLTLFMVVFLTRHSKYSSLCAKQAKAEVVALQFAPSVSVLRTVTFLALEVPSAFLHVSARKVIVMAEFGTF